MGAFGGNSTGQDLNEPYDRGDTVWVVVAGLLVWLMIPGIGFFYAGLSRKKHALSLVWASMMTVALVTFQWFFWGYTFVFSHKAGDFWGKINNFSLMKVLADPSVGSDSVPDIVYCLFQGMFACVTGIIMLGGAHERARLGPMMLFLFIWITIVYCPIAEWTWNTEGWLASLGALDFAGGGPVHMASGIGALAYALICGKRKDPVTDDRNPVYKPGSVLLVVFGTIFLWFGWFGFNGGSTGNATIRSWYAIVNTNVAASTAALVWLFIDYARFRKWSTVGMCSGAIAGLVGITPAAGFVPVWTSVAIGAVTAACCNAATLLKFLIRIDDGLDVFALHGVGGAVGSICTSLFAANYVFSLDGVGSGGPLGWFDHHYVQLPYQLAAIGSVYGWSFVVTSLILVIMNYTPILSKWTHIRMTEEDELVGSDRAQLQEYEAMFEGEGIFSMGTIQRKEAYPDAYDYRRKSRASSGISALEPPTDVQQDPRPVAV